MYGFRSAKFLNIKITYHKRIGPVLLLNLKSKCISMKLFCQRMLTSNANSDLQRQQ